MPYRKGSTGMTDDHKELSATQARQGVETGTVRWVLHISLGLAILAGVILYLIFFGF
jgi:hypothetical protein